MVGLFPKVPPLVKDDAVLVWHGARLVIEADGHIDPVEAEALTSLGRQIGYSSDGALSPEAFAQRLPHLSANVRGYFLFIVHLTSWLDGEHVEAERGLIDAWCRLLAVSEEERTAADREARRAILATNLVVGLSDTLAHSPLMREMASQLGFGDADLREIAGELTTPWRSGDD